MSDLISREALKITLQARHDFYIKSWGGFSNMPFSEKSRVDELTSIIAEIINAPTVELTEEQAIDKLHETGWLPRHDKEMTERPQGEWLDIDSLVSKAICSKCQKPTITEPFGKPNYCPNCGADMRGNNE